ncbi:MAG: cysteine-rich CWC family protein [Acidobacteriota bacterium]|nr:cysteine-rich CWC family protein [Acidobacteriota bacterium]
MSAEAVAPAVKRCPRCGHSFGCGQGEPGCWCESVVLSRETLAQLRSLAEDCLCPDCLAGFAEEEAESGAGERHGVWAKAVPHDAVRARGVPPVWAVTAALLLGGAVLAGLAVGPVGIGVGAIAQSLLAKLPLLHVHSPLAAVDEAILWQLRAPRIVLAALVGAMLAIAGSAYQGVFRNPLADPYLLGVAAGAGLGATLVIAYAPARAASGELLPLAAFAGAAVAVAAAYLLGRSVAGVRSSGVLILAGVTVAAFLTAVQTFVQQQHSQTLQAVYSWLLGGFGAASWHQVVLVSPYIAVSATAILLQRRLLDVINLGDEEAASLGLDVRRVRLLIVVAATVGTAAAVAVSGLIGFVGIIVPHTIRLLVSSSYRAIVPLSLLVGGAFLVLTDLLARTVMSPAELPIGVVTAFFGAPFFALVLRTTRRFG